MRLAIRIAFLAVLLGVSPAPAAASQEPAPPPATEAEGAATPGADEAEPSPREKAEELAERVRLARAEIDRLDALIEESEGDDLYALSRRLTKRKLAALEDFNALVDTVLDLEKDGTDVAELRELAESVARRLPELIRDHVDRAAAAMHALEGERDQIAADARSAFELRVAAQNDELDALLTAYVNHVERMEALGLETADDRAYLALRESARAERLSARLDVLLERRRRLEAEVSKRPVDDALRQDLLLVQDRIDTNEESLRTTVANLERLDQPVTQYRETLVAASGELSADLLDPGVLASLTRKWVAAVGSWLGDNGATLAIKVAFLLLILLASWLVSRAVRTVVHRGLDRRKAQTSELLKRIASTLAGRAVLLLGLLVGLSQLGVSLGPLLAGLGIAGFVIGFALQDTLSNFSAGAMILLYRPYDVGDLVQSGDVFGKVEDMTFVSTTILTFDNQRIIVPNNKIWGDVITNVTAQSTRRVDLTFGISYGDDIPQAEKILMDILTSHEKVLEDPAPNVKVHGLGDSSVDFVVRPWVKTEDYWEVYWDVTREVKLRFDREGVTIPFPQRDVHLHPAEGAEG